MDTVDRGRGDGARSVAVKRRTRYGRRERERAGDEGER